MRGRVSSVGNGSVGDPSGGRPERLASDDPYPGRHALADQEPTGQLELHDRAREGHRRAAHGMAARARHGRLELDQRHALCARRAGRFRRLGADGLPRLELRRRAALLQEVRALRAGRRRRGARPGRAAQGRGLPHHPAAHPSLRRSRATGGLPVQSRSQRQAAPGRRLFADDAARAPARLDGADFSARGQGAAQPARRDRGAGRQAAVRGQALRRCHLPARRQPHRGARQPRGDRVGRHHQLAAHPADLGHRARGSTCSRSASRWCTTWPESAPTSSTTT